MSKLVSLEQLERFRKDGVILLKGVLDPTQVENGRRAIEQAISKPGPQAEFISEGSTWESVSGAFQKDSNANPNDWIMFQDQFSTKRCPEMSQFLRESNAGRIAAELMDSKTATFFYDHVICKMPNTINETGGRDHIPWHQDLPYWNIDGTQIASVWIPFDAMPETAGVRWVLGSHRWGLFQPRHFVDASPYAGTEHMDCMPDIDKRLALGLSQEKTFAVKPGDVLVFDARIIHCSGSNSDPNNTPHRRVAFRFGGDDAVYFERKGETAIPSPEIKHGLSHGDPLACEAFPLVWCHTTESQSHTTVV